MANVDHHNLTGSSAIHPSAFVQASDPGAVGTHKRWIDTSVGPPYQEYVRNASNSGWEAVGTLSSLPDPTTTRGDLIYRGAAGLTRRAVGTVNQILVSDGTDPVYTSTPIITGELSALDFKANGVAGAANTVRIVGGNASGAPASGTFVPRDVVVNSDGTIWICTAGGTPGTWVQANTTYEAVLSGTALRASGLTGATNAVRIVGGNASGAPTTGTFLERDMVIDSDASLWVCTSAGSPGTWTRAGGSSSGSSGGGGSGALTPIQVIGPLTAAQASLDFTAPQTGYRNLRIVLGGARGDTAAQSTGLRMRFNGDTGGNYNYQNHFASSTSASASAGSGQTSALVGDLTAASATANFNTSGYIDLPNYAGSFFREYHSAMFLASSTVQSQTHRGWWANTTSISTISLFPVAGNFAAGTYACLYGEMDTAGILLTPASNLLFETTLSAVAANIDTGTLSQAYRDLRIEASVRGDSAATFVSIRGTFNGDATAGNYESASWQSSQDAPLLEGISSATSGVFGASTAATAPASSFTPLVIDIPSYTGAQHKSWFGASQLHLTTSTGDNRVITAAGRWKSTAAITRIVFTPSAGNFAAGTSIRVYGDPAVAGGASTGTGTRLRLSGNLSVADATDTIVSFDTEDSDADNQHYTSAAALTGTVTKTAASATLAGSGTAFTTELSVGQVISVPGTAAEKRVVIAIASNTSLTVNAVYANSASGQTATRLNSPIVIRQPGHYTFGAGAYWASDADGYRSVEFLLNDTTPFGRDDRNSIGAVAMGLTSSATRQFQMWDFVELRVHHTAGAALNLTADERTYFTCNARPTVIVAAPRAVVEDQKSSGTAGGTFTSGAWQTRTLNTVVNDPAGIVSLASNQITLRPGTYRVQATAQASAVNQHQLRLQDVTNAVTLVLGSNAHAQNTNTVTTNALLVGGFTLSVAATIELQHRCQTTVSSSGYGIATSWGTEVYASVELRKEG